MTKTFKDLFAFLNIANAYQRDDKLMYAFKKMTNEKNGRLQEAMEEWNEAVADLKHNNASVDEKGNIFYVDGPIDQSGNKSRILTFTPAGQIAVDKGAREMRKKTFEFEPYYATEIPKDLDEFTRETLIGFVIKEETELKLQENGKEKETVRQL